MQTGKLVNRRSISLHDPSWPEHHYISIVTDANVSIGQNVLYNGNVMQVRAITERSCIIWD